MKDLKTLLAASALALVIGVGVPAFANDHIAAESKKEDKHDHKGSDHKDHADHKGHKDGDDHNHKEGDSHDHDKDKSGK